MLGKALKDNGLVAEIVSIFYCEKSLYANVSIPKNKSIQWVKSLDGTIDVYLLTTNNKEAFLSYSTANVKDWQTIFSDSLARYKKLITPEPTLLDLIKQAFPSYKLYKTYISESGNFICYGSHNSITLEVTYNPKLNLIELFTVKERGESGEYYFSKSRDFFTKENLTNYFNWEQWLEDLIKVNQNLKDLEQLLPVSKESTLVDLIKQAFPSYQWSNNKDNTVLTGTYPGWTHIFYVNLELENNNIIRANICASQNGKVIYKVVNPESVFTKENLANYTNWEQWLEDLINYMYI